MMGSFAALVDWRQALYRQRNSYGFIVYDER